MALITPADVREYTVFKVVKNRLDAQLSFDIIQAETDVFKVCGHKFIDPKYSPLPETVKLALIKATEFYALMNTDSNRMKGYKSEKIGDYQYTLDDGQSQTFSLQSLLADYIESTGQKSFRFRAI